MKRFTRLAASFLPALFLFHSLMAEEKPHLCPVTEDAGDSKFVPGQVWDVKQASPPDFRAGYDEWRKACGGVDTISVAGAVKVGEERFRKNLGCDSNNSKI